jgi:hypothetical protein
MSYDLLLSDPMRELLRMQRGLAIDGVNQTEMDTYVREFVDSRLHHHAYNDQDLAASPAIAAVPLCVPVYALMMRAAQDEISLSDPDFLAAWQPLKQQFDKLFPLYDFANEMLKETHQLQREIRIIRKSIPWKLMYPLRLIVKLVRSLRVQPQYDKQLAYAENK